MECQLAYKYVPGKLRGKEFVITPKLDGIRCLAVKTANRAIQLISRQSKAIKGFNDIEEELKNNACSSFVLDGELLAQDGTFKTTSRFVSTQIGNKKGVLYHVFDMVSVNDWATGKSIMPYDQRRAMLYEYFTCSNNIEIVPILYQGNDESAIEQALNDYVNTGGEGIMINVCDAPYEFKRTNSLLKLKPTKLIRLKVIDYKEGFGKYGGTLGALVVDYKGFPVSVGSGFTDAQRNEIWKNIKSYIGKNITVQYFEETSDAKGALSLRFPVYKA